MRNTLVLLCVLPAVAGTAVQPRAQTAPPAPSETQAALVRTFDRDRPGGPPDGFTLVATRQPAPGAWVVRRDAAGQHLVHEADSPVQPGFSLAVAVPADHRNVVVSARVKLTGGDRSAGLVWRFRDARNYYAATLDLARHELALVRVVQGNRIRLGREDDLELDAAAWHTLKVIHEDSEIRVYLGGIRVLAQRDRTFRAGAAGLWASSGTTAAFDDFRVQPVRERER
jgi:hypothetical protein